MEPWKVQTFESPTNGDHDRSPGLGKGLAPKSKAWWVPAEKLWYQWLHLSRKGKFYNLGLALDHEEIYLAAQWASLNKAGHWSSDLTTELLTEISQ